MHSHYNYKNNRTYFFICTLIIITLGIISSVAIAAEEQIRTRSLAETMTTVEKNGKQIKMKVPVTRMLPGKTVYYTTKFKNVSRQSVNGVNIINPIPKLNQYIADSATGKNTPVTFSIDGGKRWSTSDKLKKKDKHGNIVLATAADYTYIRWGHNDPLPSGKTGNTSFQVKLLKP